MCRKTEDKPAKEEAAGLTKEEVQKSLVKFYMGLEKEINSVDIDLNTYEGTEEPDAEQNQKPAKQHLLLQRYGSRNSCRINKPKGRY